MCFNGNVWALWIIYADDLLRFSQSWDSLNLRPEEIRSVTESASEWLGASLGQHPTERPIVSLRLSTSRSRSWRSAKSGLEDNTDWYGRENTFWVNMVVCFCLLPSPVVSPSHHRSFGSKKNNVTGLHFYYQDFWFLNFLWLHWNFLNGFLFSLLIWEIVGDLQLMVLVLVGDLDSAHFLQWFGCLLGFFLFNLS